MFQQVALACKRYDCSNAYVDMCISRSDLEDRSIQRVPLLPDLIAIDFINPDIEIERYCHRLQTWTHLNGKRLNKSWFGAQLIGSKLYTFGGEMKVAQLNTVCRTSISLKLLMEIFKPHFNYFIYNVSGLGCLY